MAQYYQPGYEAQRFQRYSQGLQAIREGKEEKQKERITTGIAAGKTVFNVMEGGRKDEQTEALRRLNLRSEDTPSGFKYESIETEKPEGLWGRIKHRYRPAEERVRLQQTYEERDLGKTIEDLGYQDPDKRLGKFDPTAYGEGLRKKSEMYRRGMGATERQGSQDKMGQRIQELSTDNESGRFRFTPESQSVGEIGQLPRQSFGRTTVGRDLPYGGREREYTATGPGSLFGDMESEIGFDPQYEFAPGTGSIRPGSDPFPEQAIISDKSKVALSTKGIDFSDPVYAKQQQQMLIDKGYDLGRTGADSIWGPKSQAAWSKYTTDIQAGAGGDDISQVFEDTIWSRDEFESFGAGIGGAGSLTEAGSTVGAGESLISEGADTAGGRTPYASIAKGVYETQDVYRSGASKEEMRKQTLESGLDVASSYAISSGNPYLMAAGVGYKVWDRFADPWA
jgi:hypothetical protein